MQIKHTPFSIALLRTLSEANNGFGRKGFTADYLSRRTGMKRPHALLNDLESFGLIVNPTGRKRNITWKITDAGRADLAAIAGGSIEAAAATHNVPADFSSEELEALKQELAEMKKQNADLRLKAGETMQTRDSSCPVEMPEGMVEHPTFGKLARMIAGGVRTIWLTGEAGLGKTTAAEIIAEALQFELFVAPPSNDKFELLGFKDAGGTYQESEVYRWATHEGKALLLLDEVDAHNAASLLSLNTLENGFIVFPNGRVKFGKDHIVIATANTNGDGATMRYNGRQAQDAAFVDRFAKLLHWGQDDATEMAIAQAKHPGTVPAVRISWKIRQNIEAAGLDLFWGPRRTYSLCESMALGFSAREAAVDAGLCKLSGDDLETALRGVE